MNSRPYNAIDDPSSLAAPRRYRVAYIVSHPIPYQAPLLQRLAMSASVAVTTWFLDDFTCREYRDREFGRKIEWDTPLLTGYPNRFVERGRFGQPNIARLLDDLREFAPDVVWIHGYADFTTQRIMTRMHRAGIPVLLRGESTSTPWSSPRPAWKLSLLRGMFQLASGFLAIGKANRRFYEENGVSRDRIFDMPYAVDNHAWGAAAIKARGCRSEMRRKFAIPDDHVLCLFVGKLVRRKRPLDLLHALIRQANDSTNQSVAALFVGDGEAREELEHCMKQAPHIVARIAGFVRPDDLPPYFAMSDVLVLPSEHETWGLVANEAMASGLPVLAADRVGAGPDLIVEGKTGFTFATGDIEKLAGRLSELEASRDRLNSMGHAAQRHIQRYDFTSDEEGLRRAIDWVTST